MTGGFEAAGFGFGRALASGLGLAFAGGAVFGGALGRGGGGDGLAGAAAGGFVGASRCAPPLRGGDCAVSDAETSGGSCGGEGLALACWVGFAPFARSGLLFLGGFSRPGLLGLAGLLFGVGF